MNLLIIGAGGHGKVVEDIAIQTRKYETINFLDDNSKEDYLRFKKIIEKNTRDSKTKDSFYSGVHVSYDLIFGKTSFTIQTGVYLWQRAKDFQPIYHRFGLKYRFSEHWMANLTLKTFWAAADFAEWGIGYRL